MTWSNALKWVVRYSDDKHPDLENLRVHIAGVTSEDLWTKSGNSILHLAAIGESSLILEFLLQFFSSMVTMVNECEETPLHWAARQGTPRAMRILVAAGADINAKDGWHNTPLHFAVENGKVENVQYLLSVKANKKTINADGLTPAALAVHHEEFQIVQCLEEEESDTKKQEQPTKSKGPLSKVKRLVRTFTISRKTSSPLI